MMYLGDGGDFARMVQKVVDDEAARAYMKGRIRPDREITTMWEVWIGRTSNRQE